MNGILGGNSSGVRNNIESTGAYSGVLPTLGLSKRECKYIIC
jgi:hypothetical protein